MGFAQNEKNNWTSYYEDENVQISYQLSDCLDQSNKSHLKFYFLKIENKTSNRIKVQYEVGAKNSAHKGSVYGKRSFSKSVALGAKEIQVGDCYSTKETLKIYIKNIKQDGNTPVLDFQLSNIKTFKNK